MEALIVGGGIGGLTTALSGLPDRSLDTVLSRSSPAGSTGRSSRSDARTRDPARARRELFVQTG
jgi:hypothetical protein